MVETLRGIDPEAVYTLREACRFLRISEATARRWLKEGRLPGRKIGRDYRFFGRDLLGCLEGAVALPDGSQRIRAFGPDHPLLALAGIGESGRGDISEEHDRYLATLSQNDA